jgi:glycosyltransferase involved in cell wall biosynthesis
MDKKLIDVSVIVPVYNCKKHLRKCVSSILNQSVKTIEVILINDGSYDGSEMLCEEFKTLNEKVIVIHQENKGVSAARNKGIKLAKGKFLLFVDADDYIEEHYIEKLLTIITSENYDIVASGGTFFNQFENYCVNTLEGTRGSSEDLLCTLVNSSTGGTVWGKLVRSSLIKENNIYFNEEYSYREDLLFWLEVTKYIESYTTINYFGYFYRMSHDLNSLSTKYDENDFFKQLKLTEYIEQLLNNQNIPKSRILDILGNNVTSLLTGTILKQARSGKISINNVKKIIKNDSLSYYIKFLRVKNKKDYILVLPIKLRMVYATFGIYKLRCYLLQHKDRQKLTNNFN